MNVPTPDWLAQRAAVSPDAPALLYEGRTWSYGALHRLVNRYAHWLREIGVAPGERLALLLPSGPAFVCLVHAAARLGAVLVPLNARLTPAELVGQLVLTDPSLLLYETEPLDVSPAAARRHQLPDPAALPADDSDLLHLPPFALHRLQGIVFTSGSAGSPKGVQLTFANHFWSAVASALRLGLHHDDRWLSCLPLYHVGGLAVLFRCSLYGIPVILHPRFDVAAMNHSLDHDRATLVSLVPTMLHRLLAARASWPAHLRLLLLGGAAAPPRLLAEAEAAGAPVALTYGLTEAGSQVATMMPSGVQTKPGSAGKPLMFTQVRILDEQGRPLPAGAVGEIVVSGPTVTAGYWRNEPATAAALRDGYLHTGDLGYLDHDGDLWPVQRRSDLIVTGGENVFPAEVEDALRRHPRVLDACVVGLPDPEWGQLVAALVAVGPAAPPPAEEPLAHCRALLAGYKLPRRIRFTPALPLTASGKVARDAVRASFGDSHTAAIAPSPNRFDK